MMLEGFELSGYAIERFLLEIADQAFLDGELEQGCFAISRLYAILDARGWIIRPDGSVKNFTAV